MNIYSSVSSNKKYRFFKLANCYNKANENTSESIQVFLILNLWKISKVKIPRSFLPSDCSV